MIAKDNVIRDFTAKRDTYYESNYASLSPRNYVRRLRRQLIVESVGTAADNADVLDAGCGPAILFPEILHQCRRYTALDLTPSNLDRIQADNTDPRIKCVVSDLDNFNWESLQPDVIICSGAIEYVAAPEKALERMINCLRPGGLLVCSFPNRDNPYRLWSQWIYTPLSRTLRFLRNKRSAYYARRLFSPTEVKRQVKLCVGQVQLRFFGHRLLLQPIDALFPSIDYRLAKAFASKRRTTWNVLASEFLVVASK